MAAGGQTSVELTTTRNKNAGTPKERLRTDSFVDAQPVDDASICCGTCNVFVAVRILSFWNFGMAVPFLFMGIWTIFDTQYLPENWRGTFTALVIPGILKLFIGGQGLYLVPILQQLTDPDNSVYYRRPEQYVDHAQTIAFWNSLALWTPWTWWILSFAIIGFLAIILPENDILLTYPSDLWILVVFIPAIIDCAIGLYFFITFKKFMGSKLKAFLFACPCLCCPCTDCCPSQQVGPQKCC